MARGVQKSSTERIEIIDNQISAFKARQDSIQGKIDELEIQKADILDEDNKKKLEELIEMIKASGKTTEEIISLIKA
jgi:septal ring factor EnvC (AmiA/AmiB activator)